MGNNRCLRHFWFALPLIWHLVASAAWTVVFHQTTTFTASALASSRSKDEELSFLRESNPNVNSTNFKKDASNDSTAQRNSTRSDARNSVQTLQYSPPPRGQRRQPERSFSYGERGGKRIKSISDNWDSNQQQRVLETLSEIMHQGAPESPSTIISTSDIASGKEVIQAWSKSTNEPDPSGAYDEELYRAVFSQEPDYFEMREKEKEYLEQKEREERELSPEAQRQKDVRDKRKKANRLKLVQGLADFIQELELSEEKQPSQLRCRACRCTMTSHSAASQGQICQVCYADSLATAAKNEPIGQQRRQYRTNPNLRSYTPPVDYQIRQQPRRPRREGNGKMIAFGDLVNGMLENENQEEEKTNSTSVAEESHQNESSSSSSPWCEMTDPDTGKIFYWNEETEEMRWEL